VRILFSRLRKTFGWRGIQLLPFLFGLLLLSTVAGEIENQPWLLLPYLVLGGGALITVVSWGVYRRSGRTLVTDDVVASLVASRREYGLILRPFGACGEVVLRNTWRTRAFMIGWLRPTSTLEQVVARAFDRRLGLPCYAMVDQNRTFAPPGPIYLRAPHGDWQPAVDELIRRARAIVLILSPKQELRDAVWWELHKILGYGYQPRLTILLPPFDQNPAVYREARERLCVILAALDDPLSFNDDLIDLHGNINEARISDRIARYDEFLPAKAPLAISFFRENDDQILINWWGADPDAKQNRTFYRARKKVAASTYLDALRMAFDVQEPELAKVSFNGRYPWSDHQPSVRSVS
jgi:hypothetical protein